MRTIETKVYQFDELSDRAKERARDWMRQANSENFNDWSADAVLDDAARMADLLGINLRTRIVKLMNGTTRQEPNIHYSIGDRDAGASFDGTYYYRKNSVQAVAKEAPATWTNSDGTIGDSKSNAELNRIAQTLYDVQKRHFYKLAASISHTRNAYTGIRVEVEHEGNRDVSETDAETVREALQDFATWIHRALEAEYEYRTSDEAVDEDIRANEYEFTEDGSRA